MKGKKRGSFMDIIFIFFFLVVLAIVILSWGKIKMGINENYQESGASDLSKGIMQESADRQYKIWDGVFFIVTILMILTFFVLSYSVNTHPALYFVFFFILAIVLVLGGIFGNIYDKATNTTSLHAESEQYKFTDTIMDNIVMFILVVGFIGLILLFSRSR